MKKLLFLYALSFCLAGAAQTHRQMIQTYLEKNADRLGLSPQDVSDWMIESEVVGSGSGVTSVYIVQQYSGIEVFNAQSNVSIKEGSVIMFGNNFKDHLAEKINTTSVSLTAIQAIKKAYQLLGIPDVGLSFSITASTNNNYKLSDGIHENPINAKLVYQYTPNQKLRLAWNFQFFQPDSRHLWDLRIDAVNGLLLEKNDLTIGCNFDKATANVSDPKRSFKFSEMYRHENTSLLTAVPGTYKAIPYNYESPNHHSFELISTAGNPLASPNGWHDTNYIGNSLPALRYTFTRGNNVFSKGDRSTDSPGSSVDGGTGLYFDFPYSGPAAEPPDYAAAAKTNLFYMVNVLHDVWYQYGFDEASGNFQQNNYARGGLGNDYIISAAQYGYTPILESLDEINNAYFTTPSDGGNGRMEMLLWDRGAPPRDFFRINTPTNIAGTRVAHTNSFLGTDRVIPAVAPNGLTSDLVLYNNNPTPPGYHSGCQTPTNAAELSGKIVLIKRGGCNYNLKVKNAQIAGALAVVIMDSIPNNTSTVVNMASNQVIGITIPAVSISKEIGDELLAEMDNGPVNITLEYPANVYRYADSDFDNLVIAHEFGHGISNRLIGGPLNATCMTNGEELGEGWSDWFGLMMQLKEGDSGTDSNGIATYCINQPPSGAGIRTFPYSTDLATNPLTLADSNNAEDHHRGEVWAAVLWDLSWAYIDKYGFDPDIYNGTGGNNKVMRLVLDALKLEACNTSSFISSRDKLFAADQATTSGRNYCLIADVFTRRGIGLNASSGDLDSAIDQVADFTPFPEGPNCALGIDYFNYEDMIRVYPNPTKSSINIRINQFVGKVNIQMMDVNGRTVFNQTESEFNIEKNINIDGIQSGVYILKLSANNLNYTQKVIKN